MLTPFQNTITRLLVGSVLVSTVTLAPQPVRSQAAGDIIVIGDSPSEWSEFQAYWQQLLNLNAPPAPDPSSGDSLGKAEDPQLLAQKLLKNLKVNQLRLEPIIRLNGSSQATGSITNNNDQAVTVASINLEVVDSSGKLVQTASAVPEPTTLRPGQTVTFTRELLTVPADAGYKIRLLKETPFVLQGGV